MDIGPPPEFREDGSPPPVTSAPVAIAYRSLNKTVRGHLLQPSIGDRAIRAVAAVRAIFNPDKARTYESFASARLNATERATGRAEQAVETLLQNNNASHLDWREVRYWLTQAVYECFWRREDPVTQLPPGSSSELTLSLKVGISEEHVNEIVNSLGISGENALSGISFQASDKTTVKLAISHEKQIVRKQTLTNSSNDKYRRLAIWYLVHRIAIIPTPSVALNQRIVLEEVEFILSDAPVITYKDVALI